MLSFLFTEIEKENISKYTYSCVDNSMTGKYFKKFWNYLQSLFPNYVAPNVISIASMLVILYGWNLCYNFYNNNPVVIGLCTILCIFTYMNLDSIYGIHAIKTKNSSPIGELIGRGCGSIGIIFLGLIGCSVFGINDNITVWYVTQILCLGFQYAHLNALVTYHLTLGKFTGPVEILIYFCILIGIKIFGFFQNEFIVLTTYVNEYAFAIYSTAIVLNTIYVNIVIRKRDKYTANGCTLVYMFQIMKAYLIQYNSPNMLSIISDGTVLATMSFDIITTKMAKKNLSQWIVIILIISQLDRMMSLVACLVFIGLNIYEISDYVNIPVLTTNINVYCCGVFDLCHNGHKKMFKNCMQFGNNLIVGVHSDEDVKSYKRLPIMTHEERCEAVSTCKYVSKVLPNANLFPTEKELDDNNIHFVVCSDEYFDISKDPKGYYRVARERGILRELPYSKEISTSDLLKRAVERGHVKITN